MAQIIKVSFVSKSIELLRSQKTHPFFAGYLHLKQRSVALDQLEDLKPDFQGFFKFFFYIEGHPIGTPYLRIFTEKTASSRNLWLNMNVAGSYAPSSLRGNQPFRKVVNIEDKIYSLPPDHAHRALKFLLYDTKVRVVYLAAFLYRDFVFDVGELKPSDLINTFAYEFGYSYSYGSEKSEEFYTLFSEEYDEFDLNEWTQDL